MSHTQTRRRQQARGERALLVWQRQTLVVLGSFLIGIVMEWIRSLPVILHATWRIDTLVVLLGSWSVIALLTWWRETKQWVSPAVVAMLMGVLFLGTLMTHSILAPH